MELKDNGPDPYILNIEKATIQNKNYRTTLWTGKNLQLTVMCINAGDDIGLEVHDDNDQFLRIEAGFGRAELGSNNHELSSQQVSKDDAVFVPAGTWHNIVNTGSEDLKVYSIYAPVKHPHGTVHVTKEDAEKEE
jgi:mannose-6-phosphate isomerase-like protein (cupin superfamily)